jgi:ABC-type transport system involved in multi-copper enzyme maturation permease subunit
MNRRAIRAIIRKDSQVIWQNKGVMIPMIVVPMIMFIVLPALAAFIPLLGDAPGAPLNDLQMLLDSMPEALQESLGAYTPLQQVVVLALVYMLAPMYLIVPLMVASVIAADSFAGEKERKTLEALFYTPTTDQELLLGKLLAAWLPAVAVALIGFLLYSIVANLAAWPTMGAIFFPTLMWGVLAIFVAPAVAGLGLLVTVLISARAEGFQDAYQMSAVVVLPLLLLVIGQATGVMYLSTGLVVLLGAALWLIDILLLWWGGRWFRRTRLLHRI